MNRQDLGSEVTRQRRRRAVVRILGCGAPWRPKSKDDDAPRCANYSTTPDLLRIRINPDGGGKMPVGEGDSILDQKMRDWGRPEIANIGMQ